MRSLSRHQLRRRPHAHQSCEATDRNSIQGRCGPVSEPTITKPSSFIRIGKSRACAAKVKRVTQGELQPGSGSRPCAESRSRAVQAARRLQQSAEAVVRLATCHWRSEGPNREEQGGATDALGSRILLRPESTDPARVDQPALSVSPPGDSGAELAPLPGTAWCGPACQVVWGARPAMAAPTGFICRLRRHRVPGHRHREKVDQAIQVPSRTPR